MATPKAKKTAFTDEEKPMLEWFYKLDADHFVYLCREWNEANLVIKLKRKKNYDDWFNYFKKLKASAVRMLVRTGIDILDAEGYAALTRWADIISNPARIDKVHQANLSSKRRKSEQDIVALALANDRLGVLKATRDSIADKLAKGAGARDTAALAREMTEIMTQIADYEKRLGPKKGTMLGQLMDDMPGGNSKRAKDKGARNTSFRSRVTIDDVEDTK